MLRADLAPLIVTSVSFTESTVEISFFEKSDQGPRAALIKNLIVQNEVLGEDLEELLELLNDIVDKGLLEIRNPPEVLNPRERLRKAASQEVVEVPEDPDE